MRIKITLIATREYDLTSQLMGQTEHGQDASAVNQLIEAYRRSVLEDPELFIEDAEITAKAEEA